MEAMRVCGLFRFTWIPDDIHHTCSDLDLPTRFIYSYLGRYSNDDDTIQIDMDYILEELNIPEKLVTNAIRSLLKNKYMERLEGMHHYRFLDKPLIDFEPR